jgi:hypothetical protein
MMGSRLLPGSVLSLLILALSGVASAGAPAQSDAPVLILGEPVGGVRLGAAFERETGVAGEPVIVLVSTWNGGEAPAPIHVIHYVFEYSFELMGPDGKPAPPTRFGRSVFTPNRFSARVAYLHPGQVELKRLPLGRLFDMSEAGTYTVVVSRTLRSEAGGPVVVRSGRIAIELREPQAGAGTRS